MSQVWIFGRFILLTSMLISVCATIGCEQPLSMLRMILAIQGESSSGRQDETGSASGERSKSGETPLARDLMKDWKKPIFALFITGRQHGYMEPCGCTGLANQKGGLMRRHTALKTLEERGWDLVKIDSGNQVRRFGQQPTLKQKKTFESLCAVMDYDVVGLGFDDLKIASIDLAQSILETPQEVKPFVCANVEVIDAELTNRFRVVEANGKKIGVTMVLGDEYTERIIDIDGITTVAAAQGLTAVVPPLLAEKCDLNVLVAATSLEKCRALARQFPVFDVLITSGGAGDPTLHPEIIQAGNKTTQMVQVGVKGMYVGVIGFYQSDGQSNGQSNGEIRLEYERIPLDDRFEDSPEMKKVFLGYQAELKRLWLSGEFADIEPRLHPSGFTFVGSDACADCHDEEFEIWANGVDGDGGPHEKATRDLTNPGERAWVQRHFDPECVSCHMTGWNPQNFYPYVSGYLDLEKDTLLYANGCENCHGPGSDHIDAERNRKDDQALLDRLRDQMRVTIQEARESACAQCHDLDNSPEFVKEGGFDEYWPKIQH
jgi:hypothetical protein